MYVLQDNTWMSRDLYLLNSYRSKPVNTVYQFISYQPMKDTCFDNIQTCYVKKEHSCNRMFMWVSPSGWNLVFFFYKVTFVYKEYTQYNVTSTVHKYLSCFDILDKEAWYHTLLVTLNVNTKKDTFSLYLTHLGSKRAFLHCQTCLYLTSFG